MIIRSSFKVAVYEAKVTLYVVDSMEEMQERFNKKGLQGFVDVTDTEGFVIRYDDSGYTVVLQKDNISHNVIAHELFHLAKMMCTDINIEDEESQAWLNGYVTECVYKILKKKNITVNE